MEVGKTISAVESVKAAADVTPRHPLSTPKTDGHDGSSPLSIPFVPLLHMRFEFVIATLPTKPGPSHRRNYFRSTPPSLARSSK